MGKWRGGFLVYVTGNILVLLTKVEISGERVDLGEDDINLTLELLH